MGTGSGTTLVVVGASAGGIEALDRMFGAALLRHDFAYVVALHLSPNQESTVVERLRARSMLEVKWIDQTLPLERGVIYVMEPASTLRFEGDVIRRVALDDGTRESNAIDLVFRSAAANSDGLVVGVILSGTASDGAEGARAIREAGGTVVVQDPRSAAFDSMPRAVIATRCADLVLLPEQILEELAKLVDSGPPHYFGLGGDHGGAVLRKILANLRSVTTIGFHHYKTATVVRRIQRRMSLLGVDDPRDYARLVSQDADEARRLQRDLLIGVTQFQRDGEAFESLRRQAFPRLFAMAGDDPLRIWVAACSTGEEAYTVAMMLADACDEVNLPRAFRIFATDVHREAIASASEGVFSATSASALPDALRARHLVERGGEYVVHRDLRDRLLFSCHDVIEDPHFSRIHLISCRNLLIYLKPQAQERMLRSFANALVDDGVLWLGSSETIGNLDNQFSVLHSKWRLYQARPGRRRNPIVRVPRAQLLMAPVSTVLPRRSDHLLQIVEATLAGYAPPTIIIRRDFELVYRFGDLGELLHVPLGMPSLDVRQMVSAELSAVLRSSWTRLLDRDGDLVHRQLRHRGRHEDVQFDVRTRLIRTREEKLMAVMFEGLHALGEHDKEFSPRPDQVSPDLEDDGFEPALRIGFHTAMEELESSNEELLSTNEEVIAANEELQAANEELQSVNEELHSVNAERQDKVHELMELADELDEILEAIDFGVVVLDEMSRLVRFNTAATRFVNLLEADVGRPFSHASHRLDITDLHVRVAAAAGERRASTVRVAAAGDRSVMITIRPRRRGDGPVGVIVMFAEVTDVVAAEGKKRELSAVIDLAGFGVVVASPEGKILAFNPRFAHDHGRDPKHLEGQSLIDFTTDEERSSVQRALLSCARGTPWNGILQSVKPNGDLHWEVVDLVPSAPRTTSLSDVLRVSRPLTALLPQGLLQPHHEFEREYWLWNPATDHAYFTPGLAALWGVEPDHISMAALAAILREPGRTMMVTAVQRALEDAAAQTVRVEVDRSDGCVMLETRMQRQRGPNGELYLAGQTARVERSDEQR